MRWASVASHGIAHEMVLLSLVCFLRVPTGRAGTTDATSTTLSPSILSPSSSLSPSTSSSFSSSVAASSSAGSTPPDHTRHGPPAPAVSAREKPPSPRFKLPPSKAGVTTLPLVPTAVSTALQGPRRQGAGTDGPARTDTATGRPDRLPTPQRASPPGAVTDTNAIITATTTATAEHVTTNGDVITTTEAGPIPDTRQVDGVTSALAEDQSTSVTDADARVTDADASVTDADAGVTDADPCASRCEALMTRKQGICGCNTSGIYQKPFRKSGLTRRALERGTASPP